MNCKNVQARLSAYVDRELVGTEMFEMRDHLDECADCRAEETEFRILKRFLGGVAPVQPSSDFADRLVLGVLGTEYVERNEPKRRTGYVYAFAAAAAMVATLLILPTTRPPQRSAPGSASSSTSSDYALEINRDQLYEASGDPLSGGHVVSTAVYGR